MTAHIRKKENGSRRSLYLCDFSVFAKKPSILCSQLIEITQKRVYSIVVTTCRHMPAEIIKKRGVSVKKRILSILLAALMLLSALPLGMVDTAYAAETSGVAAQSYYVAGGQCGDDLTWTLDSSGTLTISGTGPMYNYSLWDNPWCDIALRSSGISTRVVNAVVSSGVTALGERALADCGSMVSVSLPETLLTVGESCFMSSDALRSITIPNSVRSIGLGAFTACKNLLRVTLGRGLQRIGGQAFRECSSLSSIVIPDGVKKIEYLTFSDCANLMEITIPHTVTVIENHAFANCNILSRVTFTGTRAQWNAIDMGDDNDPLLSANITFAGSGPAAPSVTGGNDSQGRPTLKWKAVSGAAKYEVYRARSKDGDYIKYATVTGTSYTNTSYIENGNTYYYKVRALDANGTAGAWSSVVSVTYKQTLPAPTVTGGNDSQGRPTLKWNAVSGAAKYEVYRARSKDGDYIKYSTVTGTSYTNTSYIESGNTYYYKVRALDANGTAGAWSSVVSVTYKQTLPAPTVTGGNDSQGRPTLKWNAVSGAAKYEVYRARSKDGDYIKYSTVTGTSYTNTSYIENGNTYYYKVRALKSDGTAGAWSSVVSVTYKQTLPAPTVTGGNDTQGRPTLTWKAVTGAAKYEVYRARSLNGDYIKYSTVTGTSYTNTSYIENGNTYYYKVRALKSDGTAGAWSSIVSVTYRAASTGTLSAPTVTGGNDAQGRPTLKWKAVTGAAKYEIYRSYSRDGSYSKYSTQTSTAYTNSSYLTSGTTYYYKVRALDANGNAGPYSAAVSVTCRLKLSAPSVTGGKDSQGRPTLKWNAVSGAAKYEVYRSASRSGTYTKYSTQTSTSYTNSSYLTSGTTYYYKVRALGSDGSYGPYSSVASVTYRATSSAVPAEVTMGKATAQGNYITVTWDKAANAASYRVYRRVNNSSDWNVVASSVSGTSYTDWNVEPGVRYTYTVRGVAADGQTLSKTYNKTGVTVFATINSNNVASDSLLLKPSVNIPSNLTRMNWDYIGLYYYHGQTINAGLDDFGGMLRLLFNSDGTVYLVSGNGTSRGVYYANDSVISIMFPDDETPQVYMVTFMRTEKYTYLHLMPDASGREALVFSAGSYR